MDTATYLKLAQICERFEDRMEQMNLDVRPRIDRMMDLEIVHKTVGLDLDGLLAARDVDFMHDIAGITRYLDRTTGQLTECFLPRYAKR